MLNSLTVHYTLLRHETMLNPTECLLLRNSDVDKPSTVPLIMRESQLLSSYLAQKIRTSFLLYRDILSLLYNSTTSQYAVRFDEQ